MGTFVEFLDHWQTGLTGLLGFGAAIAAVWFALRGENRKSAQELESLRRSLGIEIRQCVLFAIEAHRGLRRLAQTKGTPITSRMVESLSHLPEPVIYRACADRVGMLGPHAMDVANMYGQLELVRFGIQQILHHRTPDDIPARQLATVAQALMITAQHGRNILPGMRTKVPHVDDRDAQLIEMIGNETSQWQIALQ